MSSPAGLQQSQTNFLAQWMPSSSRAGVILNPSPDLAESLRYSSTWDSRDTEDSFSSHFAPLPASRSSSCLSVHAIDSEESVTDINHLNHRPREKISSDKQASGPHGASLRLAGETHSMDEMISQSQELPLTLKLDQLRQWQKHMQEQLKAQQLEELLRLQEEQQRLLGLAQGGREGPDCTGSPSLTEADWGESSLQTQETPAPKSPPLNAPLAPANWRQGNSLQGAPPDQKQVGPDTLGTHIWNYRDQQQSVDESCEDQDATAHAASSMSEDLSVCEADETEADPENRPIKPGIIGQKRTFEELLEEQLRLEDQKLRASQPQQQSPESTDGMRANPKRAFLKRGEGLSRFTNQNKATVPNRGSKKHSKPQPQVKVNVPRSSESRTLQKAGVNQRPPVQRKTAVLNKENRPRIPLSTPQEPRAPQPAAARVLGAHQRQNTDPPDTAQPPPTRRLSQRVPLKEASNMKLMQSSQLATVNKPSGPLPRLVTKQVGLREGPGTSDKGAVSSARDTAKGNPASVRIPEYSFELSFQERLRRWESERQTESVELGEFELLEQAAEELSFSSNSSFVTKVLQLDRQQHRHLQSSRGGHPRRLSSTPIKSPRPSPPKGPEGGEGERRSYGCGAPAETGEDLLRSAARAGEDHDDEEEDDDEDTERKPEASDISSTSSSEFGDEVVAGSSHVPTFPSSLCFSTSNPPYDKRSYQDQGRVENSGQGGEEDDHSMVSSDPDDSTLLEDKEDHQGHLVFDDDDTWNDLEETGGAHAESLVPAAMVNDLTSPERMLTRKTAMVKGVVPDRGGAMGTANQDPDPPPTSQLMTRLFPTLKPKAHIAPSPLVEARHTEQGAGQQGQQSRQLRERLVELELEIERFRKENSALAKLRQENEQSQESLRKERAEFEQRKAEELARFEEFRKEETRRLQKERQVFEKHASAARAIPDKKERQEILCLKQQLSSLQEELRRRESRWSTTHSRLRQQVEALGTDNGALREEVRTLERLRLSTWKSSHADADKERKDKPGFFESSSGTKTVKFASPPESMRSSPPQISHTTRGSPGGSSPPSAGGIRSSLKRSNPAPSPEALAGRGGSPGAGSTSQDTTLNQEHSLNLSPRAGDQQTEETSEVEEQQPSQEVLTHPDGKTERLLPCGGRLILFPNGTRKEVSADGQTAKVTFFNGDIKQVLGDQRVVYYYAEAQTTHTTYPDGMEVLQFPNNQTEKHFSDGRKEITFPDQTIKNLFPDGKEESVLTDGTVVQVNPDGTKVIQFITGQREVHTAEYKRREYPDGTVKTVFTDGRQETRYPTGRVRAKDKDGNVVMDN
ncbi:centromere protein J isoform X3 [Osmerus eperlanus]|uniref:centromere protein J isoform X3 n=1 Tax=Osmerus eperlanus TaxID=29151 RepID=UPI002E0FBF8C